MTKMFIKRVVCDMKNFLKALLGAVTGLSQKKSSAKPRDFIHLVGDFNRAGVKIDGRTVDLSKAHYKAAQGNISAYYLLKHGKTTYVLWDKPDQIQSAIQKDRAGHFAVAAGHVAHISDSGVSVAKAALPVLRDAVNDELFAAAYQLRCIVAQRRLSIPRL